MALTLNGTATQFLSAPLGLTKLGATPITLSCWARQNDTTITNETVLAMAAAGMNTYSNSLAFTPSNIFKARDFDATSQVGIGNTPAPPSVWAHYAGTFSETATTSVVIPYVNGVAGPGANVTGKNNVGTTLLNLLIGSLGTTTGYAGDVAECAIWLNTILGPAEMVFLAGGGSPMLLGVRPTCYYPLRADLLDYGPRRIPLTVIGGYVPIWTDHP